MDVRQTLVDLGCVLEGEFFFALKSGRVANKYVDIDPLLIQPALLDRVVSQLAMRFNLSSNIQQAQVLAAPAVGAIPIVYAFQHFYSHDDWCNVVFADKVDDGFELSRMGFAKAVKGKPVIVIEDIASTGESARKTAKAVTDAGGYITAFGFIWNRDRLIVSADTMGAPIVSLVDEPIESFVATQHPHWGEWPLVTDIGHPKKFPDYPGPHITLL